jgi:MFS family permease
MTVPLALAGAVLFVMVEWRSAAPLVDLGLFRDRIMAAGFATSLLATSVVMASLVVGPYYLSGVLGLGSGQMGLVMAAGPVVAAFAGVPAGRLVERWGAPRATLAGLAGMETGACLLWAAPPSGPGAYVASLAVITAGYALFQAANNTAVMSTPAAERRGVVSGLLGLSRNLGLISGAAFMGAVFMQGTGASALPSPEALVSGFRACFGLAALLLGLAIVAASKSVVLHGQETTSDAVAPRVR